MKRLALIGLLLGGFCFGQSAGITVVTVGSGATPTLTANAGITNFVWTLSGNVTSSTFSSAAIGFGTLSVCENSTGGYTITFPANFVGFGVLNSTAASACQYWSWYYDGTNVNAITASSASGGTPVNTLWCPFNDACTYDNTNAQQPVTSLVPMYLVTSVPYPGVSINNITFNLYTTGSGGAIAFYFMNTAGALISGSTCIVASPSNGVVNNCSYGSSLNLPAGPVIIGMCSVGGARVYAAVGSSNIGAALANQGESSSTYKFFQEGTSGNYCTGTTPVVPSNIGTKSALSGSVTLPGLAYH